jgi:stage II sporulation protein D
VQAIVARSYAVFEIGRHRAEGFDLCDSTHCQLYEPARLRTSMFAEAARAAARRTAGWVLSYHGRVAEALFHADCGGYTAGADAVWGGQPVPYLLAEPDEVASAGHKPWHLSVPLERLRTILNTDARTQVGRRLNAVDVRARDVSGRASEVVMSGEFSPGVRGEDLRTVVNATLGAGALKSTRFTVTRAGTDVVFAGTGFGHGVGLCQIGAAARARRGEQPRDILAHYFPSAALVRATGAHSPPES